MSLTKTLANFSKTCVEKATCVDGLSSRFIEVMEYVRFHPTLFSKLMDCYANEEAMCFEVFGGHLECENVRYARWFT